MGVVSVVIENGQHAVLPPYEVQEYVDTREARRELFDFYRVAYPGKDWFQDWERFQWQVVSLGSRVWVLRERDTGRILGHTLALTDPTWFGGKRYNAHVATNLIVLDELKGKKQGRKLLDVMDDTGEVLWCSGSTPPALHIYEKSGWVLLKEPRLYLLPLNPDKCLDYVQVGGWKRTFGLPALRAIKAMHKLHHAISYPPQGSLVWDARARFEERDDKIWKEFLSPYAIHTERTAAILNAKYVDCPKRGHNILFFYYVPNGETVFEELVGYIVFRPSVEPSTGIKIGRIVDMLYLPEFPWVADAMVSVAVDRFMKMGMDAVVGIASTKHAKSAFHQNEMWLSQQRTTSVKERGFRIEEFKGKYPETIWLTLGDCDFDHYW